MALSDVLSVSVLCLACLLSSSLAFDVTVVGTVAIPDGYEVTVSLPGAREGVYDEEEVALFFVHDGLNQVSKIMSIGRSVGETIVVDAPFVKASSVQKFDGFVFVTASTDTLGVDGLYKILPDASVEVVSEEIFCSRLPCVQGFNNELYFLNRTHVKKIASHDASVTDVFQHSQTGSGSQISSPLPGVFADGRLFIDSYSTPFLYDGTNFSQYDFQAIHGTSYRGVLFTGLPGWTFFNCDVAFQVCFSDGENINLQFGGNLKKCFFLDNQIICDNISSGSVGLHTKMVFNETTFTSIPMAGTSNTSLDEETATMFVSDEEIVFIGFDNADINNIWRLDLSTEQYEQISFFEEGVTNGGSLDAERRRALQVVVDEFNSQQVDYPVVAGFIPFLVKDSSASNGNILHVLNLDTKSIFAIPNSAIQSDDAVSERAIAYGVNRIVIESETNSVLTLYSIQLDSGSSDPPDSSSPGLQSSNRWVLCSLFLALILN